MAANNPKYLSFDHIYTETVTITDAAAKAAGVAAYRFVKRDGSYPAAGGYAAGATIYTKYGLGTFQPFGIDNTVNTTGLTAGAGVLTSATNSTTVTLSVLDSALVGARAAQGSGNVTIYILVNGQLTTVGTVTTYAGGTSVTLGANAAVAATGVPYFFGPAVGEGYQFPNATTTPLNTNVFKYQGFASVVTNGIVILEVDSTSGAIGVDGAIYAGASGKASATSTGDAVILGRALDSAAATTPGQFIRVKLGGTAN